MGPPSGPCDINWHSGLPRARPFTVVLAQVLRPALAIGIVNQRMIEERQEASPLPSKCGSRSRRRSNPHFQRLQRIALARC